MTTAFRPHDILVLLKVCVSCDAKLRQADVANSIGLSQSEVTKSLDRMSAAGLYMDESDWVPASKESLIANGETVFAGPAYTSPRRRGLGRVHRLRLVELLVHGIKYVIPTRLGAETRGFRTAWGMPPLLEKIASGEDDLPVWPSAHGSHRGPAVEPLSPSVPYAASRDAALYELLALVDAIRIGRARERKLATELLSERLS